MVDFPPYEHGQELEYLYWMWKKQVFEWVPCTFVEQKRSHAVIMLNGKEAFIYQPEKLRVKGG